MSGIKDLQILLRDMNPELDPQEYIFCLFNKKVTDEILALDPICIFKEDEAITLVLKKETAEKEGYQYDAVFKRIILNIHSSLEAVGLTAIFSTALAENNISVNVISGYYHDHIFVPNTQASHALQILLNISQDKYSLFMHQTHK